MIRHPDTILVEKSDEDQSSFTRIRPKTINVKIPETLLVVGTGSTNKQLDILILDESLILLECPHDSLEGGGHVGKVGNTSANNEHLAVRMLLPGHEGQDGSCVVVGLLLGGRPGVFSVVGQLRGPAQGTDGVGVDHAGASTSHHRPYPAPTRVDFFSFLF